MTQFNLARVFETVAGVIPDREALVWADQRFTFAQLDERANRLANYLLSRGVVVHTERDQLAQHESGQDHIGLYLRNGNQYLEGMLGSFKARGAQFNVNFRYVEEELQYLFADSNARGVIYAAEFAPVLGDVLDGLPNLEILLQVADESGNELLPGAVDYEEALAASSPEHPGVEPSPDDLYIVYTGGTTGMPKGVLWRQHDAWIGAMGGRPFGGTEPMKSYDEVAQGAINGAGGMRTMLLPPLMHGAAQWASFIAFTNGGTLIIPRNVHALDPVDVLETVARERAISLPVVGDAMARPLIEEIETGKHDLSSLMVLANGGAPLNPGLKDRVLAAKPDLIVVDSVGASETGIQMTHGSAAGSKATSGTFTPGPDTVVIDDTMTAVLEAGHEGIGWLAQRGYVPLGYLGDADKTARTFPTIGGVRYSVPGDRARLLADGELELLGRDAVTINTGGEKVFAEEVEKAIGQHPDVADVVVVGRPSERWGNEVVAVVALREGSSAGDEELLDECAKHIARYKFPKQFVYLPTIVRSPAGKADYRWAKQQALAASS